MPRQRSACDTCASIKTACSKGHPCARCSRLALDCSYGIQRPVRTPSAAPPSHTRTSADITTSTRTRSRAKHKRSFNGCVSCVARRKKCDELVPRCGECRRLDMLCTRRRREAPIETTTSASLPAGPLHGSQFDDLPDVAWVPASDLAELSELSQINLGSEWLSPSPAAGGVEAGVDIMTPGPVSATEMTRNGDRDRDPSGTRRYLGWVAMMDENIVPEVTRPGHLHASSAMKRRADGGAGGSGGGSVAHNEATPTPIADDPVLAYFVGAAGKAAVRQWPPTEQHLLNHFVQHVARALVVVHDDDANPILRLLVPRAIDPEHNRLCIRHAMLALAASHLCKLYPNFEDSLVLQRCLALEHLKEALSGHNEDNRKREDAFTATVLLCLLEICQGNSYKWILHLHGAHALLAACGPLEGGENAALMAFMVDVYDSILCIARLTATNASNIPNAPVPTLSFSEEESIHPVFGFAKPLYAILANCSARMADTDRNRDANASSTNTIISDTRRQLLDWTCSTTPTPTAFPVPVRELLAAAEAVRWAGLLWLLHAGRGSTGSTDEQPVDIDTSRQSSLNRILDAVARIRPGSAADAQLLFPLFMAGVCAHRKSERLRIEYRLTVLESTVGMGNITAAHYFLDEFWQRWNEGLLGDTGWQSLFSSNLVLW